MQNRLYIRMKFLAVLLGLVCLACSKDIDIESMKNEVMTAIETELTKMGVDAKQAADIAMKIVDDEDNWEDLMDERYTLKPNFMSELKVKDMLEKILLHDIKTELLNGNVTKSPKMDDDDDDDDDEKQN